MTVDVLALPFDQYQRYRLVSDLVEQVRPKGERLVVLDVGGRTGLLREFLPHDDVRLVDLEPSDVRGLVLGDGSRLPYKDRQFDVVASFDTLEHVPPPRRAAFVAECARVAKRWIFLAGPYQSPEVEEAEKLLQRFLVDKLGVEHRYLEEHRHNGLPSLEGTLAGLAAAGARTTTIGHGNLERWLALMCLAMYLDYEPRLRPLAARVFRFYNANLYASDHAAPVYRHAVVGALSGAALPRAGAGLDAPVAPAGVLARFREVADEVVCFDRARDDWREERARLAEILATLEKDLSGHRAALDEERLRHREARAVVATLETDLEGHRASLADAQKVLAEEREQGMRVRAELEAELEAHRDVLRTVTADLEAHRARVVESENRVDEARAALAAVTADLEGHRAALAELRVDLDGHRAALDDARREIERGREAIAALDAHRTELEAIVRDREARITALENDRDALLAIRAALEVDLAGHRAVLAERERELADARAEHGRALELHARAIAEHERVAAALAADLDGHRRALTDVRADLDGHRRLAADLRGELEAARAEQARLLDELTRSQQDVAGKRAEIAAAARALAEQDALIGALRADLKNRWKSLKRGLGPRRPTPGEPGAPA